MGRFRTVSFKNIRQSLQEADGPLTAWQVYQRYSKGVKNQANIHAALYKLYTRKKLSRTKVSAKAITGRDEMVWQYAMV